MAEPRPIGDVSAVITCLRCGADLETVTIGRIVCNREGSAILQCTECGRQWHLRVILAPVADALDDRPLGSRVQTGQPAKCGTESGHRKHRRDGTPICDPCRDAHSAGNRRREAAKRPTVPDERRVPCESSA